MKHRARWGLIAAFLLQAGLLVWMLADRAVLLANGTEIRLAVHPVDPRDLLRGDYVILTYDISNLDASTLKGDDDFAPAETVYVTVAPQELGWQAIALHKAYPAAPEGIVLKGMVTRTNLRSCSTPCKNYHITYGLEKFFVPEGQGSDLENLRNDEKLSVDIAVGPKGNALIKTLFVNGVERYSSGIF